MVKQNPIFKSTLAFLLCHRTGSDRDLKNHIKQEDTSVSPKHNFVKLKSNLMFIIFFYMLFMSK